MPARAAAGLGVTRNRGTDSTHSSPWLTRIVPQRHRSELHQKQPKGLCVRHAAWRQITGTQACNAIADTITSFYWLVTIFPRSFSGDHSPHGVVSLQQ